MNHSGYKTLEFDKILKALQSYCSTSHGAERALLLQPSSDPEPVIRQLSETTEAATLLEKGRDFPLAGTPDARPHLEALAIEERRLEASALLEVARVCQAAQEVKSAILPERAERNELPLLAGYAGRLPELDGLRSSIERAIDVETGEVKDDASPELRSLRARLFKIRQRLRNMLESYFNQKDSRKLLSDQLITVRNGRSVLPVKAECRSQLMGIVHGSSASGATLFIEPLSTVEINNDIVALEEEERQEIERILCELTAQARAVRAELAVTVELLASLDLIQARARLSQAYRGSAPRMVPAAEGPRLSLVEARHPLLISRIVERIGEPQPGREAVPVSFSLDGRKSVLIFTGPNTGGKTVALKTAGLLALMAQAGLHLPAALQSALSVFKQIFADIGDEQSIESSLSTFSAHLRNIVEMERGLEDPSLVLLDEVGTGTDPAEGGALGTALIDRFRQRGALVLASTHHGMLKTYATTTPGVGAASFEFDPETYEPTFQLSEGATGRSLAFEVARRLGLSEAVLERARELQDEKERQTQEALDQLASERAQLGREQKRLAEERRAVEESLRRQREAGEEQLRRREQQLELFRQELSQEIARTRAQLKGLLLEARERSVSASGLPHDRSAATRAVAEAEERLEEIAAQSHLAAPPLKRPLAEVHLGERVTVSDLGLTGVIVAILGSSEVEVMVRDKKLRIHRSEIEAVPVGAALPGVAAKDRLAVQPAAVRLPERKHAPAELNVIGCTVEQALSQADKFLDDAFLSEHRTVRLIHGHGQGVLKKAIAEWLTHHPHVARHQPEGSGAVTLVELKV
jgi:DNA mismatch repair protein MutS2